MPIDAGIVPSIGSLATRSSTPRSALQGRAEIEYPIRTHAWSRSADAGLVLPQWWCGLRSPRSRLTKRSTSPMVASSRWRRVWTSRWLHIRIGSGRTGSHAPRYSDEIMRSARGPNLAAVGGVGFRHRRRCDQRHDSCHPPGPEYQGVSRVGDPMGGAANAEMPSDFGDCMVNAPVPSPVVSPRCRCVGAACAPGGPNGGIAIPHREQSSGQG
ncbi:hypothetical protein ACVWWN_000228 [Mycobacterium sp. URHB0021]